jgi:hypothetical protein
VTPKKVFITLKLGVDGAERPESEVDGQGKGHQDHLSTKEYFMKSSGKKIENVIGF